MTIIAYDGERVVSDNNIFKYGTRIQQARPYKVWSLHRSGGTQIKLVGAGTYSQLAVRADFLKRHIGQLDFSRRVVVPAMDTQMSWKLSFKDFDPYDALIIVDKGEERRVYYVSPELVLIEVKAPYACGNEDMVLIAMGAMHAGASADAAVEIACELSGNGIVDDKNLSIL